ncbi:MAG TPA: hypothetical protein VNC16_09010 [Solirubrobacterales bacterium]|nr:hypothetical protein [Solirubrobacterales bacterium]
MGVLVFLVCFLLCAGSAGAAPGERDAGFGQKGIVRLAADPAAQNVEDRIEIDAAGRYLVLATANDGSGRLLRFLPDGRVDDGFGVGGSAAAPAGTWHDLALQPDGGIVLAGSRERDFAVAALGADGQLDTGFGPGGIATVHLQPGGPLAADRTIEEGFERVRIDSAGGVVAVGDAEACREDSEAEPEFRCFHEGSAVARFSSRGDLDPSFGDDGIVFFDPLIDGGGRYGVGDLSSLALQPDGKVLAGGSIADDLLVIRLTASGGLDTSFSGNGLARSRADTAISEGELFHAGAALAVLVQRNGRIVAVGGEVMVAFRSNGTEDPSFGPAGVKGVAEVANDHTTNLEFEPTEAALDGEDRILLAGEAGYLTAVSRFYPNGAFDPRFAGDGFAHVNLSRAYIDSSTPAELATDLALTPNGAATTAGFAYLGKRARLALARFSGGDGHRFRCHGKLAAVQGTSGDDRLEALGPIVALGGDDEIVRSWGPICAGAGDDRVEGGTVGAIYGGPGDDRIVGNEADPAYGGPGDDVILPHKGYDGRNVYFGGPGDDLLTGGRGPDRLFGGPGADRLFGGPGADRLFGGPGLDEEAGAGGGGVKAVYGARGRDGFHIRLVVRGRRVTGIHLHVRLHCSNGDVYDSWFNTNQLDARIHPNGRFRYTNSIDTSEEWSETVLAGRVTREKIAASYAEKGRGESYCRTGTPRHPQIDFVARRGRG